MERGRHADGAWKKERRRFLRGEIVHPCADSQEEEDRHHHQMSPPPPNIGHSPHILPSAAPQLRPWRRRCLLSLYATAIHK